jgi:hypothetical protein
MAGGQATNSGIDYQQRIAAWCLINQYSEFDISIFFDQIDEELIIEKTHFETSEQIDDLNLTCKNHKIIFLQIKRSISLSVRDTSDFYKTIKQFTQEFIKNENTENYFGLITTSDASSKITNDLKKIVVSIRLSEAALEDNPLNESEKDTLEKYESVFSSIYEEIKKTKPTNEIFKSFSKRVFIGIIDIEAGHTVEIASHMLLKSIGFSRPELIWSILIKNSLIYATNRLSIETEKLDEIFTKYLDDEKNKSPEEEQNEFLKTTIISQGEYPTAKEVLLIESFIEELDFMIVELYRFHEDCKIKNTFYNDKIIIGNGDEWTVIQRFATMHGLDRFLEINQETYKDKRIAIIPANDIDTVEDTECAKLHKSYLEKLISKNSNPLLCLHCGKQVNDKDSLIIEVEDKDTPSAVGLVHIKCLRPIDRILGIIKIPGKEVNKHLESFDYKLWVSLMMKGQGMLNALKDSPQLTSGRTAIISWNSREEYDPEYSYCIKFILEDGSTSYAYQRSRIERVNKPQALEHLELFKSAQQRQYQLNDPLCVLSLSKVAAPYSQLLKIKKADDVILEIKSAEIAKYSKLIAKAFDKDLFHYAPLCIVRDKESETIINLSNVVPIISDPLQFSDYYENWKQIGFELEEVELKIIKSDKDFDNNMRIIFGDGFIPILDPLFDKNFNLVSGYPINEFDRMVEKMKQKQNEKSE